MSEHTDTSKKPGFFARLLGRGAAADTPPDDGEPSLTLADVQRQVKRMAKEVYKANALAEVAIEDNRAVLDALRTEHEAASADEIAEARLELAVTILPVADAIQAGLQIGAAQAKIVAEQSPEAAQMLVGWLGGQRLLRDRVLALLEAEGIQQMKPVGTPFDPHYHVAVKTISRPELPDSIVVAVERDGYLHGDKVLRFAEVIVNHVTSPPPPTNESAEE